MTDVPRKVTTTAIHSKKSKTFVLYDEDHTLGNALRHVVMRDANTDFCGYTVPHPSEKYLHLRVQTRKNTAEDALVDGAETLKKILREGQRESLEKILREGQTETLDELLRVGQTETLKKILRVGQTEILKSE